MTRQQTSKEAIHSNLKKIAASFFFAILFSIVLNLHSIAQAINNSIESESILSHLVEKPLETLNRITEKGFYRAAVKAKISVQKISVKKFPALNIVKSRASNSILKTQLASKKRKKQYRTKMNLPNVRLKREIRRSLSLQGLRSQKLARFPKKPKAEKLRRPKVAEKQTNLRTLPTHSTRIATLQKPNSLPPSPAKHLVANAHSRPQSIPSRSSKVLLVGDSLMGGISSAVAKTMRNIEEKSQIESMWKISSGLVVKKYYDWPKKLQQIPAITKYDFAVVLFGANDDKPIREKGRLIRFKEDSWADYYLQRIAEVTEILCQKSRKVFWLGVPTVRRPSLNTKIKRINNLFQKAAETHPCLDYVETAKIVGFGNSYSSYAKIGEKMVKTRASDGIHINSVGGKLIAEVILERVGKKIDTSH